MIATAIGDHKAGKTLNDFVEENARETVFQMHARSP